MDILKIRKLAKKNITVEEEAAPEPTPPAKASEAPVAPAEPAVPAAAADAHEVELQGLEADPLRDFLARYDLEEALVYEGGETAAHEFGRPRYLAFTLEGERYAVSIMDVREILRVVTLTEVPRAPAQILGVLSKRGVVMPIVDLASALGLRPPLAEMTQQQRVLVVGEGSAVAGLRVDELHEVVEFEADDIEEVPASLGARSIHLLRGLGRTGDRMFILLDVEELLSALAAAGGGGGEIA